MLKTENHTRKNSEKYLPNILMKSFSFCLTKNNSEIEKDCLVQNIGEYHLFYDMNTPFNYIEKDNRFLASLGYVVDVRNGLSDFDLLSDCMACSWNIEQLIDCEYYFGGKYVIFYYDNQALWVLGDATGTVPIFYSDDNEIIVASSVLKIVNSLNYTPQDNLVKIRKYSDISQAMPFDITIYSRVHRLLPNHMINMKNCEISRYSSKTDVGISNVSDVVTKTIPWCSNILNMFKQKERISCAITGGKDSRVVLAFCNKVLGNNNFECFTVMLNSLHEFDVQDVNIPKEMGKKGIINHRVLSECIPNESVIEFFDTTLGVNQYSYETLLVAYSIYVDCFDTAVINGDIIGQIGKCSLHRNIPRYFAMSRYFRFKLHNYSNECLKYINQWIKDNNVSKEFLFDQFSIENRLGRWAGQENLVYNLLGQLYINIFNSRCIIDEWRKIPRKKRANGELHKEYLMQLDSGLYSMPNKKDGVLNTIAKMNWVFYLIASWLKYALQRLKFIRKMR